MKKTIFGISTGVLGLIALVAAYFMTSSAMPSSGPWIGKITQFHPPVPEYGLYIVLLIAIGGLLLMTGLIFTVLGTKEHS